jgi:subtilisin family serine protease
VLALAAATAFARSAEHVLPGQKLFAELGQNDSVTVIVDLAAGTPLSLKAVAYRGTSTRLDVEIFDPDGAQLDLGLVKKVNAKASVVTVKGYAVARTGGYRITVSSTDGTQGGFDLAITGSAPKKVSGKGIVYSAGSNVEIPVEALAGDKVRCVMTAPKGSKLKPMITRFVDVDGATIAVGAPKQTVPATVATTGSSRFDVTGAADTTGAFNWTLLFVRVKAPRRRRDAGELNAAGTIRGRILVDGQSPRASSERVEKAAKKIVPDVRPGELIVSAPTARSRAEVEALAQDAMPGTLCTVTASLTDEGPYLLRVEHLAAWGAGPRAKSATRALAKSASASATGAIEYCTPNGIVQPHAIPTDPMYAQQFNLPLLKLPGAWNYTTGSPGIVVAIVDTGMIPHPDLDAAYLPGFDFVADASNAMDGDGWDSNPFDSALVRHGTHVAGLVGARANNGIGVAGAAWNVKVLPVRVLGQNGGAWFDIAAGLRWAVGIPVTGAPINPNPARVVNMSLGGQYDDPTMRAAVAAVFAQTNAVIVASAGNDASSTPSYPGAYPGVICVYALDQNLKWTSYTNYGSWITVGAPGGDSSRSQPGILSTFATTSGQPTYAQLDGTSMASPQVAGVAALVLSVAPQLDAAGVKAVLQSTATDLGAPGFDNDYGWGIVNAEAAIASLTPSSQPDALDATPSALVFDSSTGQAGIVVRTLSGKPAAVTGLQTTTDQLSGWLAATTSQTATPATVSVSVSPTLAPGAYSGRVTITTEIGAVDVPVTVVRNPPSALTFATVTAVDEFGHVVARATATAATNWTYALTNVPIGRYRITTFIDANDDQELDRVDEWDGIWPLRSQPQLLELSSDSLDADDVNLAIDRFDTHFDYSGVGSGLVTGALAVRVADAWTGAPIVGASVYVSGGAPAAYTDARGRALVVGGFNGGQIVTVAAPGYGPMTRAAQNGQYEGFLLEPPTPAPTTTVKAIVRGLSPIEKDVWVQVGDARGHAVYDGANDPSFTLTFTTTPDAAPVSATAYDSGGVPTRSALYDLAAPPPSFDIEVSTLQIGAAKSSAVAPSAPSSGFTAAGATLRATTSMRWNDLRWVALGDSPFAFGQSRQGWWADPVLPDPALPMKFEVVATDLAGRSVRSAFYGTTLNPPLPPATFAFDAPPSLTSPADGATNVAAAPLLSWSAVAGSQLHKVVVEEVGTGWRWTIWVPGTANQVQLPSVALGLKSATNYRWSVETFRFGATSFSPHAYLDEQLDADPTSRVVTAWAAFKTQ